MSFHEDDTEEYLLKDRPINKSQLSKTGGIEIQDDFSSDQTETTNIESRNRLLENYATDKAVTPQSRRKRKQIRSVAHGMLDYAAVPFTFVASKLQAGSIKGSIFTLITSTVGSGIVTLPYAMYLTGLWQGLIMFILGAAQANFSAYLLVRGARLSEQPTYDLVGERAFGPKMGTFAKINLIINCEATVINYAVLIASLVPESIRDLWGDHLPSDSILFSNAFWACMVFGFIIFPLSLPRELSALRHFSLLCFVIFVFLSVSIVAEFFNPRIVPDAGHNWNSIKSYDFNAQALFISYPFINFAYNNHPNILPIFVELQRASQRRMNKVMIRSFFTVCAFYCVVASFGYLTFVTQPDQLEKQEILEANYHSSLPILIGKLGLCICVIFALPLSVYPMRDMTGYLLWPDEMPVKKWKHFGIASVIVVSAMIVACFVSSVGAVSAFTGASTNPVVCYILPCAFFLKLSPEKNTSAIKLTAWFVLIFNIVFGIIGMVEFFIQYT